MLTQEQGVGRKLFRHLQSAGRGVHALSAVRSPAVANVYAAWALIKCHFIPAGPKHRAQ